MSIFIFRKKLLKKSCKMHIFYILIHRDLDNEKNAKNPPYHIFFFQKIIDFPALFGHPFLDDFG